MRSVLLALIVVLTGCPQFKPGTDIIPLDAGELEDSGVLEKDAGEDSGVEVEAGSDAGPDAAVPDAVPANPGLTTSSGGGTISSAGYRLRLIVSPPTPVGTTQSASYRLFLGPGPVQHQP